MQMDFLETESKTATDKTPAAPVPKQAKLPPALFPEDRPLPPLPASLQPKLKAQAELAEEDDEKAPGAFKTISEAATVLGVPQHVLRFWESRFAQIKPLKMRGGRRYYRPEDMDILTTIKHLLYKQGYTIKGAKKAFSMCAPAVEAPQPVEAPRPQAVAAKPEKPAFSAKQHSQLAVIRQELIGLREVLSHYV
jgi:DNA-binding transcriptional MerR regulator